MTRDDLFFCLVTASCIAISYVASDIYLPAMPVLREFFNTNIATIQSTISIYMVGIVVAQLIIGPIADHCGFKKIAISCAILLILASLICMAAHSIFILNVGRLLQAAGAGGMAVIGRASFVRYFPPKRATSLYLKIIPFFTLSSPLLAPIAGGFLAHYFHWQSIFICLAFIGALLLMGLILKYPLGKQSDLKTNLHPMFIMNSYFKLLTNKVFIGYL